jgi:hypothetical protein
MEYKAAWDLTTIPDRKLAKEWNRRRVDRQAGRNPGGDATRILTPCEICKEPYSARGMRIHLPQCKKAHPEEALKLKMRKKLEKTKQLRTEKKGNKTPDADRKNHPRN